MKLPLLRSTRTISGQLNGNGSYAAGARGESFDVKNAAERIALDSTARELAGDNRVDDGIDVEQAR